MNGISRPDFPNCSWLNTVNGINNQITFVCLIVFSRSFFFSFLQASRGEHVTGSLFSPRVSSRFRLRKTAPASSAIRRLNSVLRNSRSNDLFLRNDSFAPQDFCYCCMTATGIVKHEYGNNQVGNSVQWRVVFILFPIFPKLNFVSIPIYTGMLEKYLSKKGLHFVSLVE